MPLLHTPTTNMTCQDIWTIHKYINTHTCFQLASNLQQFVACDVMIFSEALLKDNKVQSWIGEKKHVVIDTSQYNNETFLNFIILFPIESPSIVIRTTW